MKRARKQKLESLKLNNKSAVPEVEPDHYQVKQINPKFSVFNRKLLRKAKRKGIKNQNEIIPQKKSVPKSQSLKQNLPLAKKPKKQSKSEEMEYEPEKWGREYYKKMLVDDEKEIEFYEKKLGYAKEKGKIRHAKENKRDGVEDLYAFLDGVDKRIHTENFNYGNQLKKLSEPLKFSLDSSDEDEDNDENIAYPLEEQEDEKIHEEEGSSDDESGENELSEVFEEEGDQKDEDELEEDAEDGNMDKGDLDDQVDGDHEEEASVEDDQEQKVMNKNVQPSLNNRMSAINRNEALKKANLLNQKAVSKLEKENTKLEQQNPVYEKLDSQMKLEEKAEAEKSIRACINRVAEGNIEAIFNKMNEIYNLHPKTLITEIHADLFIKACVEQPQCLHMIVAANTALLGALYQLYDNPLLAVFTKYLILKYRESQTLESEEQKTYLQKNIFLVFALTYDFNLFSAEFVLEIIVYLCNNFSELNLELISLIILNSGFKIRSDNPGILKRIIDYVKQAYDKFKSEKVKEANIEGCSKKMEFLMMNLNDIKINKKLPNNAKDRLEFLSNWLQKSVIKK